MNETPFRSNETCPICQNPLEGKQKFCSTKCRVKASRTKPVPEELGDEPEMSETDMEFDAFKPNFYRFGTNGHDRKCQLCQRKFVTSLSALRFCSPECQFEYVDALASNGKRALAAK